METECLILRPIRSDDYQKLGSVLLDHKHMQYTVKKEHPGACKEYFQNLEQQWHQRGFGVWCLGERSSGEMIRWGVGLCSKTGKMWSRLCV